MKQYLDLMQKVLDEGVWQENRTGVRTKMIPGAMLQFDMSEGFPAVTTKKLAFKGCIGELLGFFRAADSAKTFRDLGCNFWNQNANETKSWLENPNRKGEDDLGRIYGQQWRKWKNSDGGETDQLYELVEGIKSDPTSRRHRVTAWRPDEFHLMALPPCHYGFGVIIEQETSKMHLIWSQRSVDTFLGLPMNIASYGSLLHILARITGYIPGKLTGMLEDVHLYENHLDQVKEQLSRKPFSLPRLALIGIDSLTQLEDIEPDQFQLISYNHHPAIKAPMAA